jgi:hypothetical protein
VDIFTLCCRFTSHEIVTLHYITLHYATLHYVTYITLRYVPLRYVTFCTLLYITLQYVTLHTCNASCNVLNHAKLCLKVQVSRSRKHQLYLPIYFLLLKTSTLHIGSYVRPDSISRPICSQMETLPCANRHKIY